MNQEYDDFEYEDEEDYAPSRRVEESKPSIKYRVGIIAIIFLVGLAAIFDLVELILAIFTAGVGSYIKDFASYVVFPFLFWILGIPFWKGNKRVQKMTSMVVGAIISLIPYLSDIMPELTISVLITVMYSRVEDRLGLQGKMLQKKPNVVRARRTRPKIPRRNNDVNSA